MTDFKRVEPVFGYPAGPDAAGATPTGGLDLPVDSNRRVAQAYCAACHLQHSKPEMAKRYINARDRRYPKEVWVCQSCLSDFDKKALIKNIGGSIVSGILASLAKK